MIHSRCYMLSAALRRGQKRNLSRLLVSTWASYFTGTNPRVTRKEHGLTHSGTYEIVGYVQVKGVDAGRLVAANFWA